MPNYLDRARAIEEAIDKKIKVHVDEDPRWKCPYCGAYTTGEICMHCTAPREE